MMSGMTNRPTIAGGGTVTTNGTTPTLTFSVIPLDCCPRCRRSAPSSFDLGIPVAIAQTADGGQVVRIVCPRCRLLWDCSWNVSGDRAYGPFEDAFIRHAEGIESRPQASMKFPAGPRGELEPSA